MAWYAAVATLLDEAQLSALLPVLLPPAARASEDTSGKVHDAVRHKASETVQLLSARAAPPDFVAAYQRAKNQQLAARKARKRKAAIEAVANPELAARKRMAKNLGKRRGKVRKLERQKKERTSQASIGLGGGKRKRGR